VKDGSDCSALEISRKVVGSRARLRVLIQDIQSTKQKYRVDLGRNKRNTTKLSFPVFPRAGGAYLPAAEDKLTAIAGPNSGRTTELPFQKTRFGDELHLMLLGWSTAKAMERKTKTLRKQDDARDQ